MTALTPEAVAQIVADLHLACIGQPAKIAWPHRLLHDAADMLTTLAAENATLRASEAAAHVAAKRAEDVDEIKRLKDLVEKGAAQLALVHSDALEQVAGLALVRSDGAAFSHMQINRCSKVANEIRAALSTTTNGETP